MSRIGHVWSRKRFEIGWTDLALALWWTLGWGRSGSASEPEWETDCPAVVGLTERSCFDAFLRAKRLPAGTAVLVSALNIEGMERILREHQLVPIPVDVNPLTLAPDLRHADQQWTDGCQALLVAHLFGSRLEMRDIVDWAKARNLEVWEDCAQVFDGQYLGNPASEVRLFSFGPIKAYSALGGGVALTRSASLATRMRRIMANYPVQTRLSYFSRVLKYGCAKLISGKIAYRWLRWLHRSRIAFDHRVNSSFRNLPGDDFFRAIRRQPCVGLRKCLHRRLGLSRDVQHGRVARGNTLESTLQANGVNCYGAAAGKKTYWVFAVQLDRREQSRLLDTLDRHGFDATSGCQLRLLGDARNATACTPRAAHILENLVFLPCYREMPTSAIQRMAELVIDRAGVAPRHENRRIEARLPSVTIDR